MESAAVPEPFVPADVDLTDFKFMPLEVARLFDSEIMALEDAEAFRAGVASWCKGWHQVPAASLPNDNASLCKMLGYGRDARTWAKLRSAGALRGWVLCSDGRLYHPIVAEKALEAWLGKLAQQLSSGAGNAKRWGIELDSRQIIERIEIARRYLTALNPDSKALSKRKPPGIPKAIPQDVPTGDTPAVPPSIVSEAQPDDGRESGNDEKQSQRDSHPDVDRDSRQDRNRQGQGQGESALPQEIKSPSAAAERPPAQDEIRDGLGPAESVFAAVAKAAENWFDAVERAPHDGDDAVIRGWLGLGHAAGLTDEAAVAVIAETIDRQFRRCAKNPDVGMPRSLDLLTKDVKAALLSARHNPPKVADEPRAPAPYDARFTLRQWESWIKPCTVTPEGDRAVIAAPTLFVADRLRQHHDQDLRVCLGVSAVEIVAPARPKAGKGGRSAKVIQHPAMAGGAK